MPRVPGAPRFTRGVAISARELQEVSDRARRVEYQSITGDGAGETSSGGAAFAITPEAEWHIEILSNGSAPLHFYSWRTVRRTLGGSGGTWEVVDEGPSGTWDGQAAMEMNGNENVPSGTIRRAWLGDDGQTLVFDYVLGVPGPIYLPGDVTVGGNLVVTGDTTHDGPVTFKNKVVYYSAGAPTTIGGNTSNFALTTLPIQHLNVTVNAELRSITPGTHGQRIVYVNDGNATLTIRNEYTGDAAAQRILTPYTDHADVLFPPNCWVELRYDANADGGVGRWRVMFVSVMHLLGTEPAVVAFSSIETDYVIDQRWPFQVITTAAGGSRLNSIANGKRGQFYFLSVADGDLEDVLTIGHQDSSGAAGNLINCPGEIDYVVPSCGGVILFYDGTFWNVIAAVPTRPKITPITDANIVLPVPVGMQEFAMLGVPLTAVRTVTLPSASTAKAGTVVSIVDKAGSLGSTNYLSVIRDGSDTINGATSYAMQTPYSKLDFVSDGASKWTINPQLAIPVPISQGGTGEDTAPEALDALFDQTTGIATPSGATVDLGAQPGHVIDISGTTTITSFGSSAQVGDFRWVVFGDVLTLTHNATSLILPGGANITTAAGDRAQMVYLGAGKWRCDWYTRAAGVNLASLTDVTDTLTPSDGYVLSYNAGLSLWQAASNVPANGSVTFAKMQAVSANILLGNDASGTTVEEITCTAAGRAILDDADAAAQRTTLGLAIGTNVQAYNADLAAIAAGTWTGATSVTTLGTISAGTWQGTRIGSAYGGQPSGAVEMFAGSSIPTGWLECDGSAVSRTTYADLFSAISTTWGTGDGSTTFNLPDLRGRAPIGVGTGSGLTSRTLGTTGGVESQTLTAGNLPAHTHSQIGGTNTAGIKDADVRSSDTGTRVATSDTGSTGSGTGHNNMQPWAAIKFIIKT